MRRGVAGLKAKKAMAEKKAALGREIEQQQLTDMTAQLAEFKASLEAFAVKHKQEITRNPVFRNQFLKMCQQVGVDPLSSNKSFFVGVLGFGDFYYELAVSFLSNRLQVDGVSSVSKIAELISFL